MAQLVVSVPRVPKSAYNPRRPVSGLLQAHIGQLQTAVLEAVTTEGDAARCIHVLTLLLRELRPHTVPKRHGAARKRKAVRRATTSKRRR